MKPRTGADCELALLSPAVGEGHNVGDHLIEMAIHRFFGAGVTFRRFTTRRPLRAAEIEEINSCRCALLCGTNLYQYDWPCALSAESLKSIRVPVIPFGVGSSAARMEERSVGRLTADMIRALHDHCALGSVRDPHTAEIVSSLGVKNVRLTGCPVLFWRSWGICLVSCQCLGAGWSSQPGIG